MARPTQVTSADISLRLQAGGVATAQALATAFDVDRSTISRGIARMGESVVAMGAARRARYGLRRMVRAAGDRWPLYRIDGAGRASEWARLHALHGGWRIEWAGGAPAWAGRVSDRDGMADGFPFFLGDLRPQGFLGRALARSVAETLRLPGDPRQWGDDETLSYLQAMGHDVPGDLVVGEGPLRAVLARQMEPDEDDPVLDEHAVPECYPELAARAMAGEWAGSSAGGEQPKFLAALRTPAGAVGRVLVKFSPPLETEMGRRWADLLVAEAHALAVLAGHGLATAGARVVEAGGRRFLEVNRHDRMGEHGRRGVVSLEALYATMAPAAANDWPAAAAALERAGAIERAARARIERLHGFGQLIGNSDMHFGNLSFWLDDTLPFQPAPAYDMLPMAWAPLHYGELAAPGDRRFAPPPPVPAEVEGWREAARWAMEFWRRVGEDERVSPGFVGVARTAGDLVSRMLARFGG